MSSYNVLFLEFADLNTATAIHVVTPAPYVNKL